MTTSALTWLIALPLGLSPCIYMAGRISARAHRGGAGARWILFGALAILWLVYGWVVRDIPLNVVYPLGDVGFQVDGVTLMMVLVVLSLTTAVAFFSSHAISGAPGEEKYYATLIIMAGAVIGLACTTDLFNLWLWFEVLTFSGYFLITFQQDRSLEAGIKYLVQSAIGSALVLFGIALVLAQTGTLSFQQIQQMTLSPGLLASVVCLLIGFGVKTALVPLHTWLPDAHSQAPSGISAMLSGIVIEAALIALLRTVVALRGVTDLWGPLLLALAALNMIVGNLLALRQTQVKRMLAYSSVSQVGYLLLGFGITILTGEAAGAQGGFFHLFNHALMKGLAFLSAGALLYALDKHSLTMDDLSGAARRYPLVALSFTVGLLSLGGLPPLAGFMSKWQIFVAGVSAQN